MAETKQKVCKKMFISASKPDGASSWHDGVISQRFTFADGTERVLNLNGFPEEMQEACAWMGMSTCFGNSYANALKGAAEEGMSQVDWAVEKFDAQLESIMEGRWASKEGGPSTKMLIAALIKAAADSKDAQGNPNGVELAPEQAKMVVDNMDDVVRLAIVGAKSSMMEVRVAYLQLQQERAANRITAIQSTAPTSVFGDLLKGLAAPPAE